MHCKLEAQLLKLDTCADSGLDKSCQRAPQPGRLESHGTSTSHEVSGFQSAVHIVSETFAASCGTPHRYVTLRVVWMACHTCGHFSRSCAAALMQASAVHPQDCGAVVRRAIQAQLYKVREEANAGIQVPCTPLHTRSLRGRGRCWHRSISHAPSWRAKDLSVEPDTSLAVAGTLVLTASGSQ
jgi:hypothetical protein